MWAVGVAVGVVGVLWATTSLPGLLLTVVGVAVYAALGGSLTLWQIYATLPRDLRALVRYVKLEVRLRRARRQNLSVPKVFKEVVQRHGNKVAFYFEDQSWTFNEVEALSNRVGNYFAAQGIGHGDAVALFMENRVEYVCVWLGLTKIGAVPALINFNLRLGPLTHCIRVANCKAVVCGAELQQAMLDIRDNEDMAALPTYVFGAEQEPLLIPGAVGLEAGLAGAGAGEPAGQERVSFMDDMVYIYTSGTTGLPKAAIIKHSRGLLSAMAAYYMIGFGPDDVVYSPLPLYHLAAGLLGAGQAIVFGLSVVIKRKFSVSGYWDDCRRYNCTVGQYIGEICRYLLNMPEKAEHKQHKIRLMFGNGLRPSIWHEFQRRFKIPLVTEFYGSTEGNANIINVTGKPGAVGFTSVLLPKVYPIALLRVDDQTGEVVRDVDGLCIACKPGEPGELIGKIIQGDPVRDFHGYADNNSTKKKIVQDVFTKGDMAFLSGDLLVMDHEGYLYFKDRTGDTFRWKGENVSTGEVEAVVSQVTNNTDVVVYGVEVPGNEGRAGMAAILDPENKVDLKKLYEGVVASLPSYARPLLLRLVTTLEMTGTYKLKKGTLQKEGFDTNIVKDRLFLLDAKQKCYVPLTPELKDKLVGGQMRV